MASAYNMLPLEFSQIGSNIVNINKFDREYNVKMVKFSLE
jgi:hypothetical protein